jgi:hypothetical protein
MGETKLQLGLDPAVFGNAWTRDGETETNIA